MRELEDDVSGYVVEHVSSPNDNALHHVEEHYDDNQNVVYHDETTHAHDPNDDDAAHDPHDA